MRHTSSDSRTTTPASLQAKLDAGLEWFGSIDAIGHREVPVPGTEQSVDYRSQDPDGAFGGPMLALRTGRYPVEENEAAVTQSIADLVGTSIGDTIDLDGDDRTVVGIVENPSDLDDDFVLLDSIGDHAVGVGVDARERRRGTRHLVPASRSERAHRVGARRR